VRCWCGSVMKNLRLPYGLPVLGLLILAVSCGTVPPRMSDAVVVPVYYATTANR